MRVSGEYKENAPNPNFRRARECAERLISFLCREGEREQDREGNADCAQAEERGDPAW